MVDFWFKARVEELRRTCPSDWMLYVTRAREMPGAAPINEVADTDIILGTLEDNITKLYQSWIA